MKESAPQKVIFLTNDELETVEIQGSIIGTLGNFSASIGKAKSKKTFNVSAIVASAFTNGTVLRYAAELPPDTRKILYVEHRAKPLPLPESRTTHFAHGRIADQSEP